MKLALIGFGVVGQGFVEVLHTKADFLLANYDLKIQVVAVSDFLKGSLYHPAGLDLPQLLESVQTAGSLAAYPDHADLQRGWDALTTIRQSNAEVVAEVSYTDIKTGQPALDHCRAALGAGKHLITTNKGPIALAYRELRDMAAANGVKIEFEGTVMSGTPAVRLGMNLLAGNTILGLKGILNGTTNYILSQMGAGQSYEDALRQAQALGYAEADPTADVEGYDTLGKVLILANTVMGAELSAAQIPCQGITQISPADIRAAADAGECYKLIGEIRREGQQVIASVAPQRIPLSHPLASVSLATNAITYTGDLIGDVTLVGAGAGRLETGFALLNDLLAIL